jgi:signal recognition particle subunit SRP54
MFENLSERFTRVVRDVSGRGRLSEANIEDAVRDVRMALLEADVALPAVKAFIGDVKARAVGAEVTQSLNPGQAFIKIVSDELAAVMGKTVEPLNLNVTPPAVILMAGLQGAGKTTTVAKLAALLKQREKKSVLVASCDVYRPAAIEQLRILADSVGATFYPSTPEDKPLKIAVAAIETAKRKFIDVVILDTAGRLHIDEAMMAEIRLLHEATTPVETLFVVDGMTGQDAAMTAKAFGEALPLTGVVLTKTDGDTRGGAALSIRHIIGKPIKFVGIGEKIDALEPFHPERMASRILGMGDVLSLVEDAERKLDKDKAEKLARKVSKGKGFDLEDLRDQLLSMRQLGGIAGIMDKLPGMGAMSAGVQQQAGDTQTGRMLAIINSMTVKERRKPDIINGSRKRRIANGSGTQIQDVNRLLKQQLQMSKMMKKFAKGGMKNMLRGMQGKLPPGLGM